ncbi:MAG: penicillin-binding protein [Micromonosporaceae bacterium]|nr:penicillin-binding protein [Micromonosporaceae bacterium]
MTEAVDLTVTVEPLGPEPPSRARPTRSRRRRLWLIALVAAAALVASGGAVSVAAWYSITLPPPSPLPESTTLYFADGTLLGQVGSVQRTVVPYKEILPTIIDVAVAAEDPDFWSSAGGPITRAVIRHTMDLVDTGANSRIRIWALARKLEARHGKEYVLEQYLNAVPFGRMTYGIEAAAWAYFGKSARTTAPLDEQLTTAEAMVLLAMVRQPYPDPTNPSEFPGFDPLTGAAAGENSWHRWNEIRDHLAELARSGRALAITEAEVATLSYPAPQPREPLNAFDGPFGMAVRQALSELAHTPGSPFEGRSVDAIRDGGFSITVTIDYRIQKILDVAAGGLADGSPMHRQPENLQAAAVVVEPGTGRVLAYHGGPDPLGTDYAGVYYDRNGQLSGSGAHPPGGSFLVYPVVAALRAGHSLDSTWQWTPHEQVGRPAGSPVRNTGTCPTSRDGRTCTLRDSLRYSLTVPFYDVTVDVGVPAVLTAARDLGITALWTDERVRVDLTTTDLSAANLPFGFEVGIGQYPVTVVDQAAAMAALAVGGVRAPAHFVREVRKGDELLYAEQVPTGKTVLPPEQVTELTDALTALTGVAGLAVMTGAWEYAGGPGNSDAWSVGFTPELAIAVWVGNRGDPQPLTDKEGVPIIGPGLPTEILRGVVSEARSLLGQRA